MSDTITIIKVTLGEEKHYFRQQSFEEEGAKIITPFLNNGCEVKIKKIEMEQNEWEVLLMRQTLG